MEMINCKVNGIAVSVPKGSTILDAARVAGGESADGQRTVLYPRIVEQKNSRIGKNRTVFVRHAAFVIAKRVVHRRDLPASGEKVQTFPVEAFPYGIAVGFLQDIARRTDEFRQFSGEDIECCTAVPSVQIGSDGDFCSAERWNRTRNAEFTKFHAVLSLRYCVHYTIFFPKSKCSCGFAKEKGRDVCPILFGTVGY